MKSKPSRAVLRACKCAIVAGALIAAADSLPGASAAGDTRALSFHHLHTGEDITITFKRNGRYDDAALKKLNWFMRDWRRNEDVTMDPKLFDILWDVYRQSGATAPIDIVCGYRSPGTNAMLRARSSGVAQGSLHTHGQAMDFYIPGVPLEKIREIGLRMQRGGVGFYPTSGSPFVHLDTGNIRHWPRMTRDQLVKVFPDERTVHVPSDGQPLAGYALALADVERQGRAPSTLSLASARASGVIDAEEESTARVVTPAKPKTTLLASFFSFKPGLTGGEPQAKPAAQPQPAPVVAARLTAPTPVAVERIVPMPKQRPAEPIVVATAIPTPPSRPAIAIAAAATPETTSINAMTLASASGPTLANRGVWTDTASAPADAATTASVSALLAYAPSTTNLSSAQTAQPRPPKAPQPGLSSTDPSTTNPWMRAVVMTSSVQHAMTTAFNGSRDERSIGPMLRKPDSMLVMTFSEDPHLGLTADRFTGHAVAFLATATFRLQKTASLAP